MKMLLALMLLGCFVPSAMGQVTVNVHRTALELPVPEGYRPVSITDGKAHAVFQKFGSPDERKLLTLIPESYTPSAQQLVMPKRFVQVTVHQNLQRVSLTPEKFKVLQAGVFTEHEQHLQRNKQAKADGSWLREMHQIDPLPIHVTSDSQVAWSSQIRIRTKLSGSGEAAQIITSTLAHVLVKDKILTLKVYGQENDLEWTREASNVYIQLLHAGNPKDTPFAAAAELQTKAAEVSVPIAAAVVEEAREVEALPATPVPSQVVPTITPHQNRQPLAVDNRWLNPPPPRQPHADESAEARLGEALSQLVFGLGMVGGMTLWIFRKLTALLGKAKRSKAQVSDEMLIPRMPIVRRDSTRDLQMNDSTPADRVQF